MVLKRKKQSILFFLIIPFLISSNIICGNISEEKSKEVLIELPILIPHTSPIQGLNHDDHAELHGWAEQYVDWSFSTLPSQVINVWALEAFDYSLWISGISISGYLLSTASSGSGRFNVPTSGTWYIVFWNDETGSQYTMVSHAATFVGDTRPPSIHIYEPYSSTTIDIGELLTIDWNSINAGGSVKIELFKADSLVTTITSSTSNDGYYQWSIPLNTTAGTDYRVKISSLSTSAYDISDYFEISALPTIFIITPRANASWSMGSSYMIRWNNTETICRIKIDLYRNNTFVINVEDDDMNCGAYPGDDIWRVPSGLTPANDYRLKVYNRDDPDIFAFSDYFEITEARGITITVPNQESLCAQGSEFQIKWTSYGPVGNVMIRLYENVDHEDYIYGIDTYVLIIINSTENDGSFSWSVPEDLPDSTRYFIAIDSIIDYACYDDSQYFTIGPIPSGLSEIPGFELTIISILGLIAVISLSLKLRTKITFRKNERISNKEV